MGFARGRRALQQAPCLLGRGMGLAGDRQSGALGLGGLGLGVGGHKMCTC